MWLYAEYEAAALFSLRQSLTTASGGKTLLLPTPFAIKMALLDAACRIYGSKAAKYNWPFLRDLNVALKPSEHAVVTNLFQKVLRPRRNPVSLNSPDSGMFQRTIGYREYVQLSGVLGIALGWQEASEQPWLVDLLLNINYLGKRGSFMQLVKLPRVVDALPNEYIDLSTDADQIPLHGTLQIMDDCGPETTFDQVDIYSSKSLRVGKDRLLRHIVLPYRIERSSRSYTLYRRVQ
jgi:hypothetical protein